MLAPFSMLHPAPGFAAGVSAPPFDVVSLAEARQLAADNPYSFLRVSRAELELPEAVETDDGAPHTDAAVYRRGADNLHRFLQEGMLLRTARPQYGIYRLTEGEHTQTGVVGLASLEDYRDGAIRTHELTVPVRVRDRADLITAHQSHSGLVLTFADFPPTMSKVVTAATSAEPFATVSVGAVRHETWLVADEAMVTLLQRACADLSAIYIADGHHRSAAAAYAWEERGERPPDGFPVALFPTEGMRTLSYNRVLTSLDGASVAELLDNVRKHYSLQPCPEPGQGTPEHGFDIYAADRWQRASPLSGPGSPVDGVAPHAVSLLGDLVLAPLLHMQDERSDPRMRFVGGDVAPEVLAAQVAAGDVAAAFWMAPTPVAYLKQVADRRGVMPAKSTWFSPKLRDGFFVHVF